MNFRFVLNQISLLFSVLSALLLAIGAWSSLLVFTFNDETERHASMAFLITGAVGLVVGMAGWITTRRCSRDFERREALLLVALSWVLGAALAGSPYLLWASMAPPSIGEGAHIAFASPVNCYFEAMSGLTTTGATILTDLDQVPRSIHLWRATTHWLGGLGIVVLFVAVLPSLGVAGKRMFSVEAAGPNPRGVRPEIRETARMLWLIYLGLTGAEIIALRIAGMSWFQSITHTFSTLATGGFSTDDASVGSFASPWVDWIIILFMVLAGANFGLYYQAMRRRFKSVLADPELRLYLIIIVIAGLSVTIIITGRQINTTTLAPITGPLGALRYAAFQTVSIQTTTGFGTANFDDWPTLAKGILVLLMFVGGCAGSTAGGIKVIRLWILFRVLLAEIERLYRPNVIRPMKIAGSPVSQELKITTLAFVLTVVILWVVGTALLLIFESADPTMDFPTAATASVATLCNIGPGLGKVGPIETFAWFSDPSKLLLCLWMLLGRLEVFTILVLVSSRFWRD
jgi:trk system potassium uptake protein TrkH